MDDTSNNKINTRMNDNEATVRIVSYICIAIVLCVLSIVGGYHFTNRVAINKGLCRGSLPGVNGTYWVACK